MITYEYIKCSLFGVRMLTYISAIVAGLQECKKFPNSVN